MFRYQHARHVRCAAHANSPGFEPDRILSLPIDINYMIERRLNRMDWDEICRNVAREDMRRNGVGIGHNHFQCRGCVRASQAWKVAVTTYCREHDILTTENGNPASFRVRDLLFPSANFFDNPAPEIPIERAAEIQTTTPSRVANVNGITLGVEFEFAVNDEALNRRVIAEQMREAGLNVYGLYTYGASRHEDSLQSWVVKSDSTIKPDDNSHLAVEIVSPILRISEFDNQVRIATNVFESIGGYIPGQRRRTTNVGPTCGLHLHVGGLSTSMKCRFAAEYIRHEKAIDSILAPSRRGRLPGFSKGYLHQRMVSESVRMLRDGGYNLGSLRAATNPGRDRYRNVNNETGTKKTVELRQHQGTIDYEKTKHWKDLMLAMIERGASLNSIPGLTMEEVNTSPTITNLTSSLNLEDDTREYINSRNVALPQ